MRSRAAAATTRVLFLLVVATAGCAAFVSENAEPEVCREPDRVTLVAETLTAETPSASFTVVADEQIWVGLMADSDFSESALLSQVTGLYVIENGESIEYTRNDLDFVVTDAAYLDFDHEGQFNLFDMPPGDYQVWSLKAPEIAVVSCGVRE